MSPTKRRIVHTGLLVFALWPAVQIALVQVFEVNPWKLMGWGMYATPQMPPELRLACDGPGGPGACPWPVLPPELEAAQLEFLRRRLGLGRLARPDQLAAALFAHDPALEGLSIEVVQPVLNVRTARIEERTTTYAYGR